MSTSNWIAKETLLWHDGYVGNPLQTSNNLIILPVAANERGGICSLLQYDPGTDKCTEILEFDNPLKSSSVSVCIDAEKDLIYAPGDYGIYMINLETKQHGFVMHQQPFTFKYNLTSIIMDNKLHSLDKEIKEGLLISSYSITDHPSNFR